MEPHELLALEQLHPHLNTWQHNLCNGYLDIVLRNVNKAYRGEEFLLQLSKQFPMFFKLFADQQELDIPTYIYIEAGIQQSNNLNDFNLLKFLIQVIPNVKEQIDMEEIFPKMMEKNLNIMGSWPEYSNRKEWVESLALRWYTSLRFADDTLKNDPVFVTKLILKEAQCFKYASLLIRDNLAIALLAVSLNESNLTAVGQSALKNYELCHLALSKNPKRIQQIPTNHPNFEQLLAFALEKDPGIIQLLPKHLFYGPKKKLDQLPHHASLYLAYGATPTRLKIKQTKHLKVADQGLVQIFLIYQKEMQTFTLPYHQVRTSTTSIQFLNLDLRQQSQDQERFQAWQEELSEGGALQLQLQNIGIKLLPA
jgi:hypothetical protein